LGFPAPLHRNAGANASTAKLLYFFEMHDAPAGVTWRARHTGRENRALP
jgi:hypothetical protein